MPIQGTTGGHVFHAPPTFLFLILCVIFSSVLCVGSDVIDRHKNAGTMKLGSDKIGSTIPGSKAAPGNRQAKQSPTGKRGPTAKTRIRQRSKISTTTTDSSYTTV